MSLSEGNAKTGLEQSPVTDSRKAYGPHKSTVTTHRKSVQSVLSVQIRGKKRTHPLAYCPPGRVSSVGLSWHTSSVGVPGYSWYCLPGSRVLCEASCPVRIVLDDRQIICKERFILVYRLDEDGDLQDEGGAQSFGLGVKSSLL